MIYQTKTISLMIYNLDYAKTSLQVVEGRGLVLACSLDPQYNHGQPYPQVGEDKQQADFFSSFFTTITKNWGAADVI